MNNLSSYRSLIITILLIVIFFPYVATGTDEAVLQSKNSLNDYLGYITLLFLFTVIYLGYAITTANSVLSRLKLDIERDLAFIKKNIDDLANIPKNVDLAIKNSDKIHEITSGVDIVNKNINKLEAANEKINSGISKNNDSILKVNEGINGLAAMLNEGKKITEGNRKLLVETFRLYEKAIESIKHSFHTALINHHAKKFSDLSAAMDGLKKLQLLSSGHELELINETIEKIDIVSRFELDAAKYSQQVFNLVIPRAFNHIKKDIPAGTTNVFSAEQVSSEILKEFNTKYISDVKVFINQLLNDQEECIRKNEKFITEMFEKISVKNYREIEFSNSRRTLDNFEQERHINFKELYNSFSALIKNYFNKEHIFLPKGVNVNDPKYSSVIGENFEEASADDIMPGMRAGDVVFLKQECYKMLEDGRIEQAVVIIKVG